MSHYKSNVRDQVFNLFEVLGIDKAFGEGEYADLDADTAREMLTEMSRLAEGPVADSFVERDRNPPVFDPETHSVSAARLVQAVGARGHRGRLGQGRPRRGARRHADAQGDAVGAARAPARRQPGGVDVRRRRGLRQHLLPPGHRRAEEVGSAGRRARLGLHHGAHRAGRRLGRRRRAAPRPSSRTTAPGTSTG